MIRCPNGCQVIPDALTHNCSKHERAITEGRPFNCKIKNCKYSAELKKQRKEASNE